MVREKYKVEKTDNRF